eukprot:TRINITY_DN46_c0_g1_i1.p1 TRINITY_DN46_c0_g1~~TRINITY_DN46_c0_g1_i1.p1  ORF type:complete len:943 (+),score=216.31 TRINITY_DN46_c0_g1_i1:26303-29131(+)
MIFSRLFAPSHTSQNPEKRLEAIKNLSPEKPTEKTYLHELAFNDENADVSLAALTKLNTFVLWLKMSQSAHHAKVKRVAERTVEASLSGEGDVTITASEKVAFLKESANPEIIQQVLINDKTLLNDSGLVLSLLAKVDKPSFTQTIFLQYASEALQRDILPTITDTSILQKLEKKCRERPIYADIERCLAAQRAEAEKPIALMRELTLCLSKYQALAEKTDVDEIDTRREVLVGEYHDLMSHKTVLTVEDADKVDTKFTQIDDKVSRYLSRIRPQWEAKQVAEEQARTRALCTQQLQHAKKQVRWLYGERLCDATLADVAVVNESVRAVEVTVEYLTSLCEKEEFVAEISHSLVALNQELEAFSIQQQYGQKLMICLSQIEALATSLVDDSNSAEGDEENNAQTNKDFDAEFLSLSEQYNTLCKELIAVPKALVKRWQSASSVFKKRKQTQNAENESVLRQCRKHMSVIENLVAQGKFRSAISKFDKLSNMYSNLPEGLKKQLHKRFEKTSEEIAHLEGWQEYIAAPRKPILVEEAKTLAATHTTDIKQRADAIRYLRQQWLSLGVASDDQVLQEAFDAALEQAFQPCREHYAALDAQREQAVIARKALIENAKKVELTQPEADLAKMLEKLINQWHECGQVDKREYGQLKAQWKQAVEPLVSLVENWYATNKNEKQQLINQATALAEGEDMTNAAEKAKALQQQWKAIGHAGKRDESRLWRNFRLANDNLFSRLKEMKKVELSAHESVFSRLMTDLSAIDFNHQESDISDFIELVETKAALLPKHLKAKVVRKVASVNSQLKARESDRAKRNVYTRAQAFINVLKSGLGQTDFSHIAEDEADVIGKRWKSAFTKRVDNAQSRHWLTVALEVASDLPSPDSDNSARTNVQLSMMTARLEKGESVSANELLERWIGHGAIDNEEKALLDRVIHVIDNKPEVLA